LRLAFVLIVFLTIGLTACGSIEQAASDDCTSIGWQIGSNGYQECYKTRLYERKLDYTLPPDDKPSPSLI
jgi:hypothetical protein